jgi:hypothetical protein
LPGHREQGALRVLAIAYDHVYDFRDGPALVACAIHIEDWDGLREFACLETIGVDVLAIDEVACSARVDERADSLDFCSIGRLNLDLEVERARTVFQRIDEQSWREFSFPARSVSMSARGHRRG